MTTATNTIELNNTNCVDSETADLIFDMIMMENEDQEIEDVKILHKIDKKVKKVNRKDENGNITTEYKEAYSDYVETAKQFKAKYGDEKFTTFRIYSSLKSRLDYIVYGKSVVKTFKFNKLNKETGEY